MPERGAAGSAGRFGWKARRYRLACMKGTADWLSRCGLPPRKPWLDKAQALGVLGAGTGGFRQMYGGDSTLAPGESSLAVETRTIVEKLGEDALIA